jgi:AraC-like DNA-binding protein
MDTPNPNAKLDTMERALREIFRPSTVHPAVACALDEFAHRPHAANVSAVTSMTGLSPKRFIERFKAAVGVAPKQYCRILRFQQALAHAENGRRVDWTRIAMDSGYFDQAHFIHDFRSFAGLTPTGYQADRTQFRNHVKFLQSDAVSA